MKLIIDIPDAAYQAIQDVKDIEVTQAEVNRNPLYYLLTQAVEKGEVQKTGHWKKIHQKGRIAFAECDNCGVRGDYSIFKHFSLCPLCGSKNEE